MYSNLAIILGIRVKHFQSQNEPVISVDTKKKELIGDFKNPGTKWCEKEQPVEVRMHDFVDPQLGKAIPYGIYDLTLNSRIQALVEKLT